MLLQAAHDHRSHQPAAVGNRRHRAQHLQSRHRHAVAHRNLRERDLAPVLHRIQKSAHFTRQENACLVSEAVVPRVIEKRLFAQPLDGNFRRTNVGRFRDNALDRLIAKADMVV